MTGGTSAASTPGMLPCCPTRFSVVAAALFVGLIVLAAWPRAARAGAGDGEEPTVARTPRGINRETIGLELPLVSGVLTQSPGSFTEGQSSVEAGVGFGVRVARHRWEFGYYTPIAAGLFLASDTSYLQALTEGGLIVPGTGRRLELGAAVGAGVLRMTYSTHCDGDCNVGGVGVLVSPVLRGLFVSRPDMTVGASVRAVIPLTGHRGRDWWGEFNGFGSVVLGALEVGFGHL